jgi:thioredoxin-related protein
MTDRFNYIFTPDYETKNMRANDKKFVLEYHNHQCNWCEMKLSDAKAIDHIIPKRHSGKNIVGNYQPLCTYCHDLKNHLESEKRYQNIERSKLTEYIMTEVKWDKKLDLSMQESKTQTIVDSLQDPQKYIKDNQKRMQDFFLARERKTLLNQSTLETVETIETSVSKTV